MRLLMTPTALLIATLAGQHAQAQSAYTWQGRTLLSAGLATNGCNLRLPEATHSGSLNRSNIFVSVQNRGIAAVRITADVVLRDNNSRRINSGAISGIISARAIASMQAFSPRELRDGTTLHVHITSCAPYTP